jgi:hypothetical protein
MEPPRRRIARPNGHPPSATRPYISENALVARPYRSLPRRPFVAGPSSPYLPQWMNQFVNRECDVRR